MTLSPQDIKKLKGSQFRRAIESRNVFFEMIIWFFIISILILSFRKPILLIGIPIFYFILTKLYALYFNTEFFYYHYPYLFKKKVFYFSALSTIHAEQTHFNNDSPRMVLIFIISGKEIKVGFPNDHSVKDFFRINPDLRKKVRYHNDLKSLELKKLILSIDEITK